MVGVPGQDTSGAQLAQTISTGGDTVAKSALTAATDIYDAQATEQKRQFVAAETERRRLIRAKQAEQRAAEKALKDAQDTHVVVSSREQYEVQANGLLNELKMKYPNNPEQIAPALADGLKTFGMGIMDNPALKDDEVLNLRVQDAITQSASSIMKSGQNFQMERLPEAMRQTEEAARLNFVTAMRSASPEDRASLIEQFMGNEHNQKLFSYNYGPNAGNEMIEAVGKAYIAVGDDLAAQGDETGLKQLVNDPRFIMSVPAEAAKGAAREWETIAKQRIAAEEKRQTQAYQLNADSYDLQIGNIDVNTDYTNQDSMNDTRKKYTDLYRELSASDNPHKVKLMGELVNKITALDEKSRSVQKEAVAEDKAREAERKQAEREAKQAEKQAREARYNSPEAIVARGKIASMQNQIATKEREAANKDHPKRYPLEDQVKDHQKFIQTLNQYNTAGYMDKDGTSNYQTYYDFIYSQGDKVNQRLRKKNKAEEPAKGADDFSANFADYSTRFKNNHRNVTPPTGMNSQQVKDRLNGAYRDTMYALRAKHMQITGKEPTGAALTDMDNLARNAAYKAVWK